MDFSWAWVCFRGLNMGVLGLTQKVQMVCNSRAALVRAEV